MIGAREASLILGCSAKTVKRLPIKRVNVGTTDLRPSWRWARADVERLKKQRTLRPGA